MQTDCLSQDPEACEFIAKHAVKPFRRTRKNIYQLHLTLVFSKKLLSKRAVDVHFWNKNCFGIFLYFIYITVTKFFYAIFSSLSFHFCKLDSINVILLEKAFYRRNRFSVKKITSESISMNILKTYNYISMYFIKHLKSICCLINLSQ